MRKQITVMLIMFLMFTILPSNMVHADSTVKDCLESGTDCLEQESISEEEGSLLTDEKAETSSKNTGSIVINLFKIFFALVLVLILIYLLLALIKRKSKISVHSHALENLGGISVGQQKSIQIIRIGDKVYAIGIGNDVTMLDEITDEAVIRQLEENATGDAQPFSIIQNLFMKKATSRKQDEDSAHHSFQSNLEDELQKLKSNREQLIEMHKKDDDIHG